MISEVILRSSTLDDEDFLYSTWLNSFKELSAFNSTPRDLYYSYQKRVIEKCLEHNKTILLVNADDSEQIFSFISYREDEDTPIVSYIYTKPAFRKRGFARYLLDSTTNLRKGFYTHHTLSSQKLAKSSNLVYVPFFDVIPGELSHES